MSIGKWEHKITVPSGGWDISVTDSGGTDTVTLPDGTYYWSSVGGGSNDLPAELQAQLNASGTLSGTYTVTVSAGVAGTGKATIACDENYTLTWTDSQIRLLFGWDGNISVGTTSATSDNHVEGLWLPRAPAETQYGLDSQGMPVSAAMESLAPDGTYTAYHGPKHRRNEYTYRGVQVARVVQAQEGTAGESYESWWTDGVRGEAAWATSGRDVRWYKDADTDGTYLAYHVTDTRTPMVQRLSQNFDGLWTVTVKVVGA